MEDSFRPKAIRDNGEAPRRHKEALEQAAKLSRLLVPSLNSDLLVVVENQHALATLDPLTVYVYSETPEDNLDAENPQNTLQRLFANGAVVVRQSASKYTIEDPIRGGSRPLKIKLRIVGDESRWYVMDRACMMLPT